MTIVSLLVLFPLSSSFFFLLQSAFIPLFSLRYFVELPTNRSRAKEILNGLKEDRWVDQGTRAVGLTFNVYVRLRYRCDLWWCLLRVVRIRVVAFRKMTSASSSSLPLLSILSSPSSLFFSSSSPLPRLFPHLSSKVQHK